MYFIIKLNHKFENANIIWLTYASLSQISVFIQMFNFSSGVLSCLLQYKLHLFILDSVIKPEAVEEAFQKKSFGLFSLKLMDVG